MKLTTLLGVTAALVGVDANNIQQVVIDNQLSYFVGVIGLDVNTCNQRRLEAHQKVSMNATCFIFDGKHTFGFMNSQSDITKGCSDGCWGNFVAAKDCSGTSKVQAP
eukprot:CAMPEP_0203775034 /NCGR_PEP_ID=MMETSP0099_2-20121227/5782_1 /ASSEMBLY_ACC=CAM_ASM_000209 /TAXON_ID=96639 /ORGANISM=" , Strain NY0313808BC1" /LENGTH=106 /DNA_ID=CAMNT_0050673517 /DNA_START=252 /DNA_END=568 /DNA_ORIENTATION=-